MALQKQNYFLSITDGLDTKTDEKNVIPTRFLELENLIFTKTGAVSKRLGYQAMPVDVVGQPDLSSGNALATYNEELVLYSENQVYSFSEAQQQWNLKGDLNAGVPASESVASTGEILFTPYYEQLGDYKCYVYQAQGPTFQGTRYKVIDSISGSVLGEGAISGADRAKVAAIGTRFVIIYLDSSTNLKYAFIDTSDFNTIIGPTTAMTLVGGLDIKKIDQRVFIVGTGTGTDYQIAYIDASYVLSSVVIGGVAFPITAPDVCQLGTNDVRVSYIKNNLGTKSADSIVHNYNLTTTSGGFTTTLGGQVPFNITCVNKGTSNSVYISTNYSVGVSSRRIYSIQASSTGTLTGQTRLFSECILQSKAVTYNNVDYFILVKDESTAVQRTMRTYVMGNSNGKMVSVFDPDNSLVLVRTSLNIYALTNVILDGAKVCFTGIALAEFQDEENTVNGQITVPTTVKEYCVDFSPTSNYFEAKLGADLHISGGILSMYDGKEVVEHGFIEVPRAPENAVVSSAGATPGLGLTSGVSTYQYVIVYAWRDNQGQLHRSAPSSAYEVSVPQASPNYSEVQLNLFTTTLTAKEGIEIELYRTEANGTQFYKVLEGNSGAYSSRIFNSFDSDIVVFTDDVSDADLIMNEALYTTGGVLENIFAISSKHIVSYKNRLVILGADGKTLQYSKLRETNGPVEFNDSLIINLDEFGGPATALGVMDDHIIIFKERGMFAFTGDGPNNLGQQDDFRQPYLITSDAGCIEANSVIRTPDSLMFKSDKGIYELQRNFQVTYIGAPVELYNDNTVSSATLLETTNEIRFTTVEGRTLVYDYFHKRWTTFTNMISQDAVTYRNKYCYLKPDGTVMVETPGYYFDDGDYITSKLTSAWISLAGIQGFQRVYMLELLGNYKASHILNVRIAYDFVDTYLHEVDITPAVGQLYQFRIYPKIQRCESFKFSITDEPGSELDEGQAFTLSNIAATVGLKTGLNQVRSFGAS